MTVESSPGRQIVRPADGAKGEGRWAAIGAATRRVSQMHASIRPARALPRSIDETMSMLEANGEPVDLPPWTSGERGLRSALGRR
jgi:hypothetical protein